MLVLVTMFISVSNSLPTTAYVKMVDIWLIFNLIIPFVEVLLHTYIDYHRDDSNREINHHGTTIDVAGKDKGGITKVLPVDGVTEDGRRRGELISRNEEVQVNALKKKYSERMKENSESNKRKLRRAKKFADVCIPVLVICFVSLYWIIGLNAAYGEYKEH